MLNQDRSVINSTSPHLNNTDFLADQLGESRVELSTGGSVDVGAGALVVAQGGQIALGGGSRVLVETGANLDVSGTTNAILPASINDILVNVQPFQTRDAPGNRDTLKGVNLYVDAETLVEIAGGAYSGNIYTPGGAIEVSGYLGLIPHSIAEFTAIGGQVDAAGQPGAARPGDRQIAQGGGRRGDHPARLLDQPAGRHGQPTRRARWRRATCRPPTARCTTSTPRPATSSIPASTTARWWTGRAGRSPTTTSTRC